MPPPRSSGTSPSPSSASAPRVRPPSNPPSPSPSPRSLRPSPPFPAHLRPARPAPTADVVLYEPPTDAQQDLGLANFTWADAGRTAIENAPGELVSDEALEAAALLEAGTDYAELPARARVALLGALCSVAANTDAFRDHAALRAEIASSQPAQLLPWELSREPSLDASKCAGGGPPSPRGCPRPCVQHEPARARLRPRLKPLTPRSLAAGPGSRGSRGPGASRRGRASPSRRTWRGGATGCSPTTRARTLAPAPAPRKPAGDGGGGAALASFSPRALLDAK